MLRTYFGNHVESKGFLLYGFVKSFQKIKYRHQKHRRGDSFQVRENEIESMGQTIFFDRIEKLVNSLM